MTPWTWRDLFQPEWLLPLLLAAFVVGAWGLRRFRRFCRSGIARRALGAERAALALLRLHGYEILETQVHQVWRVQQGSHHRDINLRADALVRRGGHQFIAEVKSSALVADLKHGPTRRQLLEYAVAYGTHGVLLVDMHAERVEEITFPGLQYRFP